MEPKTELIRLVYASRASFPAGADQASLNADVARILMQSRRNNPPRGLVGALYFSDRCFFQCLEGPADEVDALYARLGQDERHRDLAVLSRESIAKASFSGWSMKYVPNAAAVGRILERHGLATFDPYRFDPATLSDMVNLLVHGPDGAPVDRPAPAAPAATADALAIARQARLLALVALAVAVASLVVVIAR